MFVYPSRLGVRTGARGKFVYLPFQGVRNLLEAGVSFHVALMSDPRLMPSSERFEIIKIIKGIHPRIYIADESGWIWG